MRMPSHTNKLLRWTPAGQAKSAGALVATLLTVGLLHAWRSAGEPVPPSLSNTRFSVAILSGAKQAAQQAPQNADTVAEAVIAAPEAALAPVVTAERPTSLPEAVKAAQDAAPGPETVEADEVIPPARVSMPGGRLMAVDASTGEVPDPFAMGPRQVYLRLYVNQAGKVTRGSIVRSGAEPMRDALILKAMQSRTFATDRLIRIESGEPMWQLDLVIDYGTNEFLP